MSQPDSLDEALADFRIDDAEALAAELDDPSREEALAKIKRARAAALDEGEDLAARIQELARNDHYAALLAVAADPLTERLLAAVSEEIRRGAYVHLDGAQRRRDLARTAARRHLDVAARALDEYDPAEARKHLDKVDASFLDDDMLEELNELRSRRAAADAEAHELTSATAEIMAELQPAKGRSKGRGCFATSVLLVLAGIGLLGAALFVL